MGSVTFEELERVFGDVIECNRKEQSSLPRESLFAHAFFDINQWDIPEITSTESIFPINLPFNSIWIITNINEWIIISYIEQRTLFSFNEFLEQKYYAQLVRKQMFLGNLEELNNRFSLVVLKTLNSISNGYHTEIESDVQLEINRRRTNARNNPMPDLPAFIRITNNSPSQACHLGGVGSPKQPHERRGHWRTYKSDNRRVWVKEMNIKGGSPVARNYKVM